MVTIPKAPYEFLYTEYSNNVNIVINSKQPLIMETITNVGCYRTYYGNL